MKAQFSVLPGGQYRATQNDDGTWDVLDVPVFTEIGKGVKGAPKDITEDDLTTAVTTHQRKFSEDQFLPRLNVLHNYGVHRPTPAGFFLPTAVKPFRMGGRVRPTIFADFLGIPDATFREMDAGQYPYCSVEVRTYEPLQFGACALLDTEDPHFEFPNITIGEKQVAGVRLDTQGGPALMYAEAEGTSAYLFRFAEDSMADEDKKDVPMVDDTEEEMAEGGDDLKSAISAIESKMKEFQPLLELLPKLQEMLSGGEETADAEEPADEPVTALSEKPEAVMSDQTEMSARVAALEDYRRAAEHEKKTERLFSATVNSLESEGYSLSDDTRDKLRAAAEKGEEVLRLFSETYRTAVPKDPPEDLDSPPVGDDWPEEVMQFSHKGPDEFAAAKEAYREWRELPNDRYRSPLDKYIERRVG